METHEHIYGRGANGRCRVCGAESNAGKKRRLARERREAQSQVRLSKPFSLYDALLAKDGRTDVVFKHDQTDS